MNAEQNVRLYRGQSMAGTFRPGDYLTLEPVAMTDIRLGDIVAYRGSHHDDDAETLVHRVVGIVPGALVVRGDSNPCPDAALVTADNLMGRVTHVERCGRRWPVHGGWLGLLRARILHVRYPMRRLVGLLGRWPYRWLRRSGLVSRLWRPSVLKVNLVTEEGPLVKYVCSGRTVACWWPERDRFECRKPYDLVIPAPQGAHRGGDHS